MQTLFNASRAEAHFATQMLLESMPLANILSVQRVENGPQHDAFLKRRSALIAELSTSGVVWSEKSHAQWVFHGTVDAAVDQIIRAGSHGFDCSSPVRNGRRFGHGVYLALAADRAHRYSAGPPDAPARRRMILCRALAGRAWQGQRDMREPPRGWHSLADRPESPSVIVLQDRAQACPCFVLTYTVPEPPREPDSGLQLPSWHLHGPQEAGQDLRAAMLRVQSWMASA